MEEDPGELSFAWVEPGCCRSRGDGKQEGIVENGPNRPGNNFEEAGAASGDWSARGRQKLDHHYLDAEDIGWLQRGRSRRRRAWLSIPACLGRRAEGGVGSCSWTRGLLVGGGFCFCLRLLLLLVLATQATCQSIDEISNLTAGLNEGGSSVAVFFSKAFAVPFKNSAPRLFTAQSMTLEMTVTGFFDPLDVDFESRQTFKRAIVEAVNSILREEEDDCCLYFENVTVTNVCDSSGNNCLNYMLNSLPEDCGDGVKLDPEMCDDANGQSGDGCSNECTIEEGFDCKFGNRFTYDICTPLPASVGTSPRRDIGGVGGSGSVRVRGAQRKLLQSSVRIAVRMSRGRDESSGMPLMVEGYMWSLSDDRFFPLVEKYMFERGYTVNLRFSGTGKPLRDLYSGSPRTFVYSLFNGVDLGMCFVRPFRGIDGSACSYIDTILGTACLGIFLMGMTLLIQCSICCARWFPCLVCCGMCWGEPACGGRIPTKRRKKHWVFRCELMLVLGWGSVMGIAVLGWRTTVQLNYDVGRAIEALDLADTLQSVFRNTTDRGFSELRVTARERMDIINRRLSSIPNLKGQTVEVNTTLNKLLVELEGIRSFIEGRRNDTDGENRCSFYDRARGLPLTFDSELLLWRLPDGNISATTRPPGKHEFGVGRAQELVNGRTAPMCTYHDYSTGDYTPRTMECPCCVECVIYQSAVRDAIKAQPSVEKFNKLDQRLEVEWLVNDISNLESRLEAGIEVVESRLKGVKDSISVFRIVMTEVAKLIDAVQFALWGVSWMALGFIALGILRSSFKYMIYGYIVGSIACVFFLFPFFGFGALVVLPFGDACSGIPRTGGDTSSFLSTFSETGSLRDVNVSTVRLVQDCLTTMDGNVWNVAGMDSNVVMRGLSRFDISERVKDSDVLTTLNTDDNDLTLAFSNNKDAIERLTADNKVYGYDTQPSGVDFQGYTTFQNGGVIDGSSFYSLVNVVNQQLVSTYNEVDLLAECQRLASDPLTDACFSNDTEVYSEKCCPETRFVTAQARVPAQAVMDYNIYRTMLQEKIQKMQKTLIEADDQLIGIKRDSQILKSNITFMRIEAENEVERVKDFLVEIASCDPFNQLYEALRVPFCQNLNASLDSVWMTCFLLGAFWILFFPLVLRNIKIFMLKKGFGKVDIEKNKKALENKMSGGSKKSKGKKKVEGESNLAEDV